MARLSDLSVGCRGEWPDSRGQRHRSASKMGWAARFFSSADVVIVEEE